MRPTLALPTPQKKFNWYIFLVLLVMGAISGVILGSIYKSNVQHNIVDYSIFKESELRDNITPIISNVIGVEQANSEQINNWVSLAHSRGVTPENLTPSQNFVLAEFNAKKASSFSAISSGKVETIATQSIYSERFFDGSSYTFSSISSGILTVATCAYEKKDEDVVKLIEGKNVNSTGADWTGSVKNYNKKEFKNVSGVLPSEITPYIVSSKTVLNNDSEVAQVTLNEKTVYKFTLKLDPVKSVLNYVKQVKQTSGLSEYPSFNNVTLVVYVDEDWNFVKTEIVENYNVKYGIWVGVKGTLTTEFTFNEPVTLPIQDK